MIFVRHLFVLRQDDHLLYFHELMDPIESCSIFSIGPSFPAITRGIAAIFFRQFFFIQHFIHMIRCYRDFRRSDQSLIIPFQPVRVLFTARQISRSDKAFRVDDIRYIHRNESFFHKFF